MAGAMRKAMVYLGLVEDDDRYDYDAYDEDGGQHDHDGPRRHGSSRAMSSVGAGSSREDHGGAGSESAGGMHTSRRSAKPRSRRLLADCV